MQREKDQAAVEKFLSAAKNTRHSGRTLYEHLQNVGGILMSVKAPGHVCGAGLFHSAYGTSSFRNAPEIKKSALRRTIGRQAERLVELFCGMKRAETFIDFMQTGVPFLLMRDKSVAFVDLHTMRDLMAIEIANLSEQKIPLPLYLQPAIHLFPGLEATAPIPSGKRGRNALGLDNGLFVAATAKQEEKAA
jgi:hypothetical protein